MRLLLDTHAVYSALVEPDQLSADTRAAALDPEHEILVSAVSVYELTFKVAIGKLALAADISAEAAEAGFAQLPLTARHAYAAGSLPLHHRDPFDRMLVAQAQLEGLTIVTNDEKIARYQVAILPA